MKTKNRERMEKRISSEQGAIVATCKRDFDKADGSPGPWLIWIAPRYRLSEANNG